MKCLQNRFFILVSIISILFIANNVFAESLYVRPNGGNFGSENGSDWLNAFDGFDDIVWGSGSGQLGAGDTLWLSGGTYTQQLLMKGNGTADNRIYILRATEDDPQCTSANGWIEGFDSQVLINNNTISFNFGNGDYITIDGREYSGIKATFGSNGKGVGFWTGAVHVELKYLELAGPGGPTEYNYPSGNDARGIDVTAWNDTGYDNCINLLVDHCIIHGVSTGLMVSGTSGMTVQYCQIYDIKSSNADVHEDVFYINANSDNGTFRYNKCWNYNAEGVFFQTTGNDNWKIYGNLFYDGGPASRGIEAKDVAGTHGLFYIYNNTIVNMKYSGIILGGNQTGGEIKNNLMYGSNSNIIGGGLTASNNWRAVDFPGVEPFLDISNDDYRIIADIGSGFCRDQGATLNSEFNGDMNGNIRGADGNWDIGAYEYTAGVIDSTPPSVPTNLSEIERTMTEIEFKWDISVDPESGISNYRIYRNGSFVGQGNQDSYRDIGLSSNTSYDYQVTAINGSSLESDLSEILNLSTLSDITPPQIESVFAIENTVTIQFNESLDKTSAENKNNYSINNGISVNEATLFENLSTVQLSTTTHMEGTNYILSVSNVKDINQNTIIKTDIEYLPSNGVKAYWNFDEGSGSSSSDFSGNFQANINGAQWAEGLYGKAVLFDGIDDNVDIGTIDISSENELSISLWFFAHDFEVGDARLISKASGVNEGDHFWMISTDNLGESLRFRLKTNDETTTLVTGTGLINANVWYHVVGTYDGSFMRIYLNGSEVAEVAKTGNINTDSNIFAAIGNQPSNAGSRPFDGLIDDVRLYNRAIDQSLITKLYTNNEPTAIAGDDQGLEIEKTVTLDGSESSDSDEDNLYYYWTQYEGAAITINGSNNAIATFLPDAEDTYKFELIVSDGFLIDRDSITIIIDDPTGLKDDGPSTPKKYGLYQNYPNPFNPNTTIDFEIPVSGKVKLDIFNLQGKRIASLIDLFLQGGKYSATWITNNEVPSGIYFYKLETNNFQEIRKMTLIR